MNRFQRSRLRASILSSSITGGGKCGSPDSARCARYTLSAGRTTSLSSSTRRALSSSDRALGAKSMGLLGARGEELDLGCRTEGRLGRGEHLEGFLAVRVRELAGGRAELDRDAVRIVGVDRRAPAVIDAYAVETVVEPALEADLEVVEVGRVERDVIGPGWQTETGRDLGAAPVV